MRPLLDSESHFALSCSPTRRTPTTWWLTILGIALAAVAGIADTGCGLPPPRDGMTTVGVVRVVYENLGGFHTYGSTSRPQLVGTFVMTNDGTAPVTVDVTATSSRLDVFLCDPSTRSEVPWTAQELASGASVEVHLRYNCSDTADISTTIMVRATDASGAQSQSISFDLDIQGTPRSLRDHLRAQEAP